jgi:hypothetical protein
MLMGQAEKLDYVFLAEIPLNYFSRILAASTRKYLWRGLLAQHN